MPNLNGLPLDIPYADPKVMVKDSHDENCGQDELKIGRDVDIQAFHVRFEAPVTVTDSKVTLDEVVSVAKGRPITFSEDQSFVDKIERSCDHLKSLLNDNHRIYGVTTSYGDSCTVNVSKENCFELTRALLRSFGCALGRRFDRETGRAILFSRLVSLSKGYSGVRVDLLRQLARYLQEDIIPVVPEEGSVGASGDLMPMSYVASCLVGEGKVYFRGKVVPTWQALKEANVTPLTFAPKECLGIMNGTPVMTALACQAWKRAEYLTRVATRVTSLVSLATLGNKEHFHPKLMAMKAHKGQMEIGHWVNQDLNPIPKREKHYRLQDRYSLRCAPHVIGVLRDALAWMRTDIENELNSVNDNPVIDPEVNLAMSGGHFYGGHIAFAMDSLKNAVASVADLMDRQLALLVDTKFSNGLPANLTGAEGERASVNLGFKALQISVSSYTAEALNMTMPTSSFSRSTECHNQDKVSMGTIAARHAVRIVELTEQVAAGAIMAAIQGLEFRLREESLTPHSVGPTIMQFFNNFRQKVPRLEEDRCMEDDLNKLMQSIKNQEWDFYNPLSRRGCLEVL